MKRRGLRALVRLPARLLVGLVRIYQVSLAPYLGGQCRYVPTCSQYMVAAVERYGSLRGGAMGLWRILRCHPFARGGYDPVP
ncbi:MAG: membrane protein insertion efficiency factor YidD [Planctomycetes bacterium]|jgi:putative membrane protein insertion efficiency factor|nr:membrane protein insertion efficiency factor YidD [Phycisphaerae bacterium]NBB94317.1 membrane protein insertion efficiency factor YidD [Planctomycetota bacterium]